MNTTQEVSKIDFRPTSPREYRPEIGLIACGEITKIHCEAYRRAGYAVTGLCDIRIEKAKNRQRDFFPSAIITTDVDDLLSNPNIEVVDIAAHPEVRAELIERALLAGKHVLSQKPFVTDLEVGWKLIHLAERLGRVLAVNQNARWAPHFRFMINAIQAGHLGEVNDVSFSVHWDHNWIVDTPFNLMPHAVLYDFAIHWFDLLGGLLPGKVPQAVFASTSRAYAQMAKPPLLAQAVVQYGGSQASLVFNGNVKVGKKDRTFIHGTRGTLLSEGEGLEKQQVCLSTQEGEFFPLLQGSWIPDGFHGTMGELLTAIYEGRQPENSARNNMQSLALCLASTKSADSGTVQPCALGDVAPEPGS